MSDHDNGEDRKPRAEAKAGSQINKPASPKSSLKDQHLFVRRELLGKNKDLSPRDYETWLLRAGYRGQEEARRGACLAAYRHMQRIKRIFLKGELSVSQPPKSNLLLLGPTGSGKTFLVRLLFNGMLGLPCVIVDSSSLTETGYVGNAADSALLSLLRNAGGNPKLAELGVICFDEFDKLAGKNSNMTFGGQGTTKDVGGWGVQQELLKMVEGGTFQVTVHDGPPGMKMMAELSTRDILFVGCGAFSGLRPVSEAVSSHIGFGQESGARDEQRGELVIQDLVNYGFVPELMGRFSRFLRFERLDLDTMRDILSGRCLKNFKHEFSEEGFELQISEDAIELLLERAMKSGSGARGLDAELVRAVEKQAFERFGPGSEGDRLIRIEAENLEPQVEEGVQA